MNDYLITQQGYVKDMLKYKKQTEKYAEIMKKDKK